MPLDVITPTELPAALARVLAPPGGRLAGRAQIESFRAYLEESAVGWDGLRQGSPTAPQALTVALLLPGRTALLLLPEPGEHGIDAAAQAELTTAALARLKRRRLHFAQVLLEAAASARRAVLERAGFVALAPLAYLERDVMYPWVAPPAPEAAEWVSFTEDTRGLFATTILATYEASLDCPELTGLRPIDDVLASHQASGRFDPALWELALVGGAPAGGLLLARHTRGALVEIVYMGVTPDFRRQGVGRLLLARAFAQARATGAQRLTVVVDERNTPAQALYAGFGLAQVAQRSAWFYRWR
jgi:mycothiol synthase